MSQELNEMLALYKASTKESPSLMMENLAVDSNRGVTSRGNSPYDKYASPETRAKVLESRLQEIEAFAMSRGIPVSNVYALAEAAMRTGKIPDLGQFGLAGDDAVATKQFLISNVLNIAGLEWTDYKGDPVEEMAPAPEPEESRDDRAAAAFRASGLDPRQFMAESVRGRGEPGLGGPPHRSGQPVGAESYYRSKDPADEARKGSRPRATRMRPGGSEKKPGRSGFESSRGGRHYGYETDQAVRRNIRKRDRKAAKQDARRAADDYVASRDNEKEPEAQQDDINFDPSRFMAEGSGGRQSLERKTAAAKKAHDKNVKDKAGSVPGERAFHRATDDTRQREIKAIKRQRQGFQQRPVRGHERANLIAKRNEALKKAGFPNAGGLRSSNTPEERRGSPQGNQGWPINRAASKVQRGQEKLKQMQNQSIEIDPSRFMAEEGPIGASMSAPSSPSRTSDGGAVPAHYQDYEKHDLLPKAVMAKLRDQIGDGVYGYTREDLFRLARSRGLLGTEEGVEEATGIVSASTDSLAPSTEFNPNPTQYDIEDELLKGKGKKSVKEEDDRSETDKILGIEPGDPRGESWPKLSPEVARLMNLESCGVFRGPRGFNMDVETSAEPISEMTTAGGMGAFIGAGIGGGMVGRTVAKPAYDDSYELPEDPEERIKVLQKMLNKHGLKPAQEDKIQDSVDPELSPRSPVVRDSGYDEHPSRWMK